MTRIKEYKVEGVRVEAIEAAHSNDQRPPILFVHGGCHGSWSWEKFLPYFADAGWECHAINWYGHNGSDPPPNGSFIQRGIAEIAEEICHVASRFGTPPVIIGHSMGGLASQKYAEQNAVAAMVLVASVVPKEVGGMALEIPVDMDHPWEPPSLEDASEMFFQNLTQAEAEHYHALLCAESPRAVSEATRCGVSIDRISISGPILVLAAESDIMTPPSTGRALADFYGADYRFLRGRGHNLLLEPRWQETAGLIVEWLNRSVA